MQRRRHLPHTSINNALRMQRVARVYRQRVPHYCMRFLLPTVKCTYLSSPWLWHAWTGIACRIKICATYRPTGLQANALNCIVRGWGLPSKSRYAEVMHCFSIGGEFELLFVFACHLKMDVGENMWVSCVKNRFPVLDSFWALDTTCISRILTRESICNTIQPALIHVPFFSQTPCT